jgi:methylglutaconyl-CoA hydratase
MGSLFIDCYRGLEAAIINRQTEFVERLMQSCFRSCWLLLAVSAAAGVAVLTLNRPDARNAIGVELLKQLRDVLEAIQLDTSARALLVCSSVPGVFCAGADLKVLATFLMLTFL